MNTETKTEAPTLQASEPFGYWFNRESKFVDPEFAERHFDLSEKAEMLTPLYDHAKPCEQCAELEAKSELWRKEWRVAHSMLTALEAENARQTGVLNNFAAQFRQQKATIAQQAERIKELEAAIELMRVTGGSAEFHRAFELAKDLL